VFTFQTRTTLSKTLGSRTRSSGLFGGLSDCLLLRLFGFLTYCSLESITGYLRLYLRAFPILSVFPRRGGGGFGIICLFGGLRVIRRALDLFGGSLRGSFLFGIRLGILKRKARKGIGQRLKVLKRIIDLRLDDLVHLFLGGTELPDNATYGTRHLRQLVRPKNHEAKKQDDGDLPPAKTKQRHSLPCQPAMTVAVPVDARNQNLRTP
jgi:hypothetical protein